MALPQPPGMIRGMILAPPDHEAIAAEALAAAKIQTGSWKWAAAKAPPATAMTVRTSAPATGQPILAIP